MAKVNWFNAYEIERRAQLIFEQQFRDGWYFNTDLALAHQMTLESNLEEIYTRVRPNLTKVLKVPYKGKEIAKPFIKSGDIAARVRKWFGEDDGLLSEVGGPFTRIDWEEPNMGSSDQMKAMLFRLGWEPTQWNTKFMVKDPKTGEMVQADKHPEIRGRRQKVKTSPKVTEDSYDSITGTGIGEDLKLYLIYRSRLSDLKRYIGGVREDHTIPSFLNNPGTPTARVTHSLVTNVAASDAVFGKEMRELFCARPGRVIVGEDRSQIEARLIAHASIQILGHSKLADLIMGRDFHQVMFEALDGLVSSRKKAKTPEYAFFFGAQEDTLGASCDNKPHEWTNEKCGAEVMKLMERNIPGIVQVREKIGKAAKRGFLVGLDGRKLFIRKPHAALNNYSQGNGAICCKWAMVKQQEEKERKELDSMQVGMYHDETQNDTDTEDAEEFGETCVQAIRDCGKHFKLKVALDGDYQIAQNWAGSH